MPNGREAARVGDKHFCNQVEKASPPHDGGEVAPPGLKTVLINGMAAARFADLVPCKDGGPNFIAGGRRDVLIGWMLAARRWDRTSHGGMITEGSKTVLIGFVNDAARIALAIDRIRCSAFGQTEEGKKVIKKLEDLHRDGKITFASLDVGEGARYLWAEKEIKISDESRNNTEKLAQSLTHEATHACINDEYPGGCKDQDLDDELRCFNNELEIYKESRKNHGSRDKQSEELLGASQEDRKKKLKERYGSSPGTGGPCL